MSFSELRRRARCSAKREMITIEIENTAEIASQQSLLARALGAVAPEIVRRRVEEKIVEQLRKVFAERGVRARIEIR